MARADAEHQGLINSLIYYNAEYQLAICQPCGSVLAGNTALHLQRFHNILSHRERSTIANYVNTLTRQRPEDIMKNISVEIETDAIEGLPIHTVAVCKACKLLGAESTIIKHCQNKHSWTTVQGMAISKSMSI